MNKTFKNTPLRLDHIFQKYDPPLYFVTFNTIHRKPLLNRKEIFNAFVSYAEMNAKQGRAIGRFVIMPDHIHLFALLHSEDSLSTFIRLLKQKLTAAIHHLGTPGTIWQPGFFDHLLRHSESYAEKWTYVRQNPVRANLVAHADDWPWQGEIVRIDRV